jgi:hypothetical protein
LKKRYKGREDEEEDIVSYWMALTLSSPVMPCGITELESVKEPIRYCKFKEEVPERLMWRNRCGRNFGPVVRQIT